RISAERGPSQAMRTLADGLRAGDSVTLAVDGPAGPAFRAKRGCVGLARAAGVPIVPVAYASRGRTSTRRWGHPLVPRLFHPAVLRFGAPIWVGDDEPVDEALARLGAALAELEGEAALALL